MSKTIFLHRETPWECWINVYPKKKSPYGFPYSTRERAIDKENPNNKPLYRIHVIPK